MANLTDILSGSALKAVQDLDKALQELNKKVISIAASLEISEKASTEKAKSRKKLTEEQKTALRIAKEQKKVEEQIITIDIKLNNLDQARVKLLAKKKLEQEQVNKANKTEARANQVTKSSYTAINIELNKNIANYKKLTDAQRKNGSEGGKLLKTIQKQDKALKKMDTTMGRSQRHVGDYGRAISGSAKSLLGAFGLIGGVAMFAKVLKDSVKVIADFNSAQSEVQAITGASGASMDALRESALQLGGTTKFTATEVSKLQVEFGRLGFSTKEILQATKATLDLAAATNTDLAQAAETAGATVRAFGFSTNQTQRVVDVMAKSFSETALNMERFSTAMAVIAPVAKNANVSLERTTAELGVLVNRGIDASTAATALRNIFLELSKQGLTWEQAMQMINTATDKNAVAFELFGKRGATVATVLAETAAEADKFTASFNDANGAAEIMATTMQDNLTGDVTRFKSAWEGTVLTVGGSGNVFRTAVQFMQNLTLSLSNFGLGFKRTSKLTQEESSKLFDFWTNRAGKDAEALKGIIKNYSDFSINSLDQQKAAFVEEVRETGLNKKKSLVIFEEFRLRRIDQINAVFAAQKEADKLESNRVANEKIINEEKLAVAQKVVNAKVAAGAKKEAAEQVKIAAKLQVDLKREINKGAEAYADLMEEQAGMLEDSYLNEVEDVRTAEQIKADIKDEFLKGIEEKQDEQRERSKEKDEAEAEFKKETAIEALSEISSLGFEIFQNRMDAEFQTLEEQKEKELLLAGDNEQQREDIEEKFAKKTSELRTKQAKAEKVAALFQIGINTAQAIMKIWAEVPKWDFGVSTIALTAVAAAIGAAQAGAILSRPIPKYAKGTKGQFNTPGTFLAGEAGEEALQSPSGKIIPVREPTVFTNAPGYKVYSNPELERMAGGVMGYDDQMLRDEVRSGFEKMGNSLRSIKTYKVTPDGRVRSVETSGYKKEYINRMIGN